MTHDNTIPVGTRLANFPEHNLGLFAQYSVQLGPISGLGVTFGMTYSSERNGSLYELRPDNSPLPRMPAYALFDAGLSYEPAGWGVQLNVANLLEKRYFPDAGGSDRIIPGEPRSFRLTFSRYW